MRGTTRSTGDPDGSQEPASKTSFGWRKLESYSGHAEAEDRVGKALIDDFSVYVTKAGNRNQSHDLEVTVPNGLTRCSSRPLPDGLVSGLYEVKSLWRKNERSAFDRRFKVGTRGESIYGRRDSQIKAFALALEEHIETMLENNVLECRLGSPDDNRKFVESAHDFIDDALARRHSRGFEERLARLARASVEIPALTIRAALALTGGITGDDILRGFSDIEGIFVAGGGLYTLVTKAEMGSLLAFDSASSEGPKLRILCDIPRSKVIRSSKGRREGKK